MKTRRYFIYFVNQITGETIRTETTYSTKDLMSIYAEYHKKHGFGNVNIVEINHA